MTKVFRNLLLRVEVPDLKFMMFVAKETFQVLKGTSSYVIDQVKIRNSRWVVSLMSTEESDIKNTILCIIDSKGSHAVAY